MKKIGIIINSIWLLFSLFAFFSLREFLPALMVVFFAGGIAVASSEQKKSMIWTVLIGNIILFTFGAIACVLVWLELSALKGFQAFVGGLACLMLVSFPSFFNIYYIKTRYISKNKNEQKS